MRSLTGRLGPGVLGGFLGGSKDLLDFGGRQLEDEDAVADLMIRSSFA
jgi:hypothetical protein